MNNKQMILTVAMATVVLLGFAICFSDETEAVDVDSASALADELSNADGEKAITLTTDITDFASLVTIGNGADVTLDLAGFDISMTGDGRIVVDSGASLTVLDSSSASVSEQGNVSGIEGDMIEVEGTLNIQGGTFDCSGSDTIHIRDKGTLNMTDGAVNNGEGTSVYFRGTANLLGGEVGKVTGHSSNCPVVNIGSPGDIGPVIGELASGEKAVVNFYSGTVKSVTNTISPQSSFTEDALFEDSSIKDYIIPGYVVIEDTETGLFHLKTNDESSSVAKIEREYFTIYHLDFGDASNSMRNGDTLTLLTDCEQKLPIPVYDAIVDLNGFDVTVTGDDSVGIEIRTVYGLKDWDPDMVVTIRSVDGASVSAATPITVKSGNSHYTLTLNIEGDVTLAPTSNGGSIVLDTAARMSYTDTNVNSIDNGGFLAELEDGTKYIFGSVAKALDADADKSVTLLNDYSLGSLGIDGEQGLTYTVDLNGKTVSPEYGEALKLYGDGAAFIIKNGKLQSVSDAVSIGISDPIDNDISVTFENVDIVSNGTYAIVNNGTSSGMGISMTGGSVSAVNGFAAYLPADGDYSFEYVTIEGLNGIQFCGSGTLTVRNCDITATAEHYENGFYKNAADKDGAISDGAAISVISRGGGYQTDSSKSELIIDGGSYTSNNNSAVSTYRIERIGSEEAGMWVTGDDCQIITQSYVGSVEIRAGAFESGSGCDAVSYDELDTDAYTISGGTFKSPVDEVLLDDEYTLDESGNVVLKDQENAFFEIEGRAQYPTLEDAIAAVPSGVPSTIKLLKDATGSPSAILIDGEKILTIDLSGYILTFSTTGYALEIKGEASVTITNSSDSGKVLFTAGKDHILVENGKMTVGDVVLESTVTPESGYGPIFFRVGSGNTVTNNAHLVVGNDAKLIYSGASIHEPGTADGVTFIMANSGSYPIQIDYSGTMKANGPQYINSGIYVNGNVAFDSENNKSNIVINVTGGTVTGGNATGIYGAGFADYNISGGEITGSTGIEVRAGKLTVSGNPTITATGEFSCVPNTNGATIHGAAVAVSQHATNYILETTISGGTLIGAHAFHQVTAMESNDPSKVSVAISDGTFRGTVESEDLTGFITGGTFDTDVTEYCQDGLVAVGDTGSFTVQKGYTVTFMVDDTEYAVYRIAQGQPVGDLPELPLPAGYGAVWTNSDGTELSSDDVPGQDVTVSAVQFVRDISVEVITDIDGNGDVRFTMTAHSDLDLDYTYLWEYEGSDESYTSESILSMGVGTYTATVTGTDAYGITGTATTQFVYRMALPEDPSEVPEVPQFDISHDGDDYSAEVSAGSVSFVSGGEYSDVDIGVTFKDEGGDKVADIVLDANVQGGVITITVGEVESSIVDGVMNEVSEAEGAPVAVDVTIDSKVQGYQMIIKIPVPLNDGDRKYVGSAVAYYTVDGVNHLVENTRVYFNEETGQSEVWVYTDRNTPYTVIPVTYSSTPVTESDPTLPSVPDSPDTPETPSNPGHDDELAPLPPVIVKEPEDAQDSTVEIVACAAAAVVAALMAAFLIMEYRRR